MENSLILVHDPENSTANEKKIEKNAKNLVNEFVPFFIIPRQITFICDSVYANEYQMQVGTK